MRRKIFDVSIPYIIHSKDLKIDDGIVYLPIYMSSLL